MGIAKGFSKTTNIKSEEDDSEKSEDDLSDITEPGL